MPGVDLDGKLRAKPVSVHWVAVEVADGLFVAAYKKQYENYNVKVSRKM